MICALNDFMNRRMHYLVVVDFIVVNAQITTFGFYNV